MYISPGIAACELRGAPELARDDDERLVEQLRVFEIGDERRDACVEAADELMQFAQEMRVPRNNWLVSLTWWIWLRTSRYQTTGGVSLTLPWAVRMARTN